MKIGAAEPESADGGAAGGGTGREPRPFFGGQIERRPVAGHLFQRGGHLNRGGDYFVVKSEGRLDESRRAGSRLGVSDLGLDRAEGAPGSFGLAVHLAQGADLHGVTYFGAGTVGFDHADTSGRHAGPPAGVEDRLLLTSGAGGIYGVPPAVAGRTDTADHGVDPVSVPLRIGQALDDHDAEPLAEDRSVRCSVKRFRVTGGREGRGLAETHVHEYIVEGIDATGDHQVGLARGEFHTGKVEGAHGAGASGVHDAIGPPQVVLLADSAGDHITEKPRKGVFLPGNVRVGDPLHHVLGYDIRDAGLFQRRTPEGMAEPGAQGYHQFQGAGYAEDDAGPAPVIVALRSVAGIPQRLTGGHQSQEL